jgi:hypothetical protein
MSKEVKAIYAGEVTVKDPETGNEVEMEIWKDPETGGMFGVDSTFLDQVRDYVPSPFDSSVMLKLEEPK